MQGLHAHATTNLQQTLRPNDGIRDVFRREQVETAPSASADALSFSLTALLAAFVRRKAPSALPKGRFPFQVLPQSTVRERKYLKRSFQEEVFSCGGPLPLPE